MGEVCIRSIARMIEMPAHCPQSQERPLDIAYASWRRNWLCAQQFRHTDHTREYWRWGVAPLPLRGGRTQPNGDAWSFEAGLKAFRAGFVPWVNSSLYPGD